MTPRERKLLEQEVLELTDALRNEKEWAPLRALLAKRKIAVHECLLGGFYEDETNGEYGLIVLRERAVHYKRNSLTNKLIWWSEKKKARELTSWFAAAKVAEEMMAARAASGSQRARPAKKTPHPRRRAVTR